MRKQHIFQTLKIVFVAVVAILIAEFLDLEFSISAGVIGILSIQRTKKETLSLAAGRFLSFICALLIGFVSFWLCGFTVYGFFLYLIFFIGVCQYFSWHSSMAANSVLVSHFLTYQSMAPEYLLNELGIFIIGVSLGILVNLHLGEDRLSMSRKMDRLDEEIRGILERMSKKILAEDKSDYNGSCFKRLHQTLYEAKKKAKENQDNQWKVRDYFDLEYVLMREKQCQILFQMYKILRKVQTTPVQTEKISHLLQQIASEYHKENTVETLYEEWKKVAEYMKQQPLPIERQEFESRALLFGFLQEMREFLQIKGEFSKIHLDKKKVDLN